MKVWKGKEKELLMYKGKKMLFIEGKTFNVNKLKELMKNMGDARTHRYLYFGAGKVEFEDFEKLKLLPQYWIDTIIIETTNPDKIPKELHQHYARNRPWKCEIVYRINIKESMDIILKFEGTYSVITSNGGLSYVRLKKKWDLNEETMMYEGDELLWED